MTREINLNHIAKIEGHAHLHLSIEKNKVLQCELKAAEGARFFEALVLGKPLDDIQEIVSRICGICSSAHTVASIIGLEKALGLRPTAQQTFIREMLMIGERIRSHATHLYFLSLPDYYDKPSVLELGSEHRDKINDALRIITLGNHLVETFGGREMHPFLKVKEEINVFDKEKSLSVLSDAKPVVMRAIHLFSSLDFPSMPRSIDCLSLKDSHQYANIAGSVVSLSGSFKEEDYAKHIVENIKEYATSKFALKDKKPYVLGALARINNNHEQLDLETKKVLYSWMRDKKLSFPLTDPHHNIVCQAFELLEALNRALRMIEHAPEKQDSMVVKPRAGSGVSAVEAPRGTLFHEYKLDKDGRVSYCNIITPTCQNLNQMERDIQVLVNGLLADGKSKEVIVSRIEKLIRSYDPCFSCSTHFLEVEWDESP